MQEQKKSPQSGLHSVSVGDSLKEKGKFVSSGQYHKAEYSGLIVKPDYKLKDKSAVKSDEYYAEKPKSKPKHSKEKPEPEAEIKHVNDSDVKSESVIKPNSDIKHNTPSRKHGKIVLNFERYQTESGKFKTRAEFTRSDMLPYSGQGLLHMAVGLRNRIQGDVPTFERWLNSQQPKTLAGKSALLTAKSAVKITKGTANAALQTGLAAETAAIKAGSVGARIAWQKIYSKYREYGTDDFNRAAAFTLGLVSDAARGTYYHIKDKQQYDSAKAQLPQLKSQRIELKQNLSQELTKEKQLLSGNKKEFLAVKKEYKSLLPSGRTEKRELFYSKKKQYLSHKKDFKRYAKLNKAVMHNIKSQVRIQNRIIRKSKQVPLMLKPVKYAGAKAFISYKQQMFNADQNNDFMAAVSMVDQYGSSIRRIAAPNRHEKLNKAQKKKTELLKSQDTLNNKLHNKQTQLKSSADKARKPKKPINKSSSKAGKKAAEGAEKGIEKVVKAVTKGIKSIINPLRLILILVIVLIILLLAGCTMCTTCVSSNGSALVSGLIATYPMKDNDLSSAEEYYTKLAWDMNQNVMLAGNSVSWKTGLQKLGVDTSGYTDIPTEYIFGQSSYFPEEPVYDFDPFLLWSFLCAYKFDFDNPDNQFKITTLSSEDYDVIEKLFDTEYEFLHHYDNTSHWTELQEYVLPNQSNFQKCYGSGTRTFDGVTYGRIDVKIAPAQLKQYLWSEAESDTSEIIYNIDNLEILNAKSNFEATGWYLQDLRSTITDPSGNQQGNIYFNSGSDVYFEKYGYWIYRTGLDMALSDGSLLQLDHGVVMAAPTDVAIMSYGHSGIIGYHAPDTDAIYTTMRNVGGMIPSDYDGWGWYRFYKAYEWTDDCRLYYTVNQKCTFQEAILKLLSEKDHAEERIAYFNLVAGLDTSATMGMKFYGNHQSLVSPTGNGVNVLTSGNMIYNGYGWDMQTWGKRHCSLGASHKGIDIISNSDSDIYAMIGGIVKEKDESLAKVVINSAGKVKLWTEDQRCEVQVTYYNVDADVNGGEAVTAGQVIGRSTRNRFCEECGYRNYVANADYIHVKVEIYYGWLNGWVEVDPRLLIQY